MPPAPPAPRRGRSSAPPGGLRAGSGSSPNPKGGKARRGSAPPPQQDPAPRATKAALLAENTRLLEEITKLRAAGGQAQENRPPGGGNKRQQGAADDSIVKRRKGDSEASKQSKKHGKPESPPSSEDSGSSSDDDSSSSSSSDDNGESSGRRPSPTARAYINQNLAQELKSATWREGPRTRKALGIVADSKRCTTAKSHPVVVLHVDNYGGAASAASAIYGDALAPLAGRSDGVLDLHRLYDGTVGIGIKGLRPLASPAAVSDWFAAAVASGAATDPALTTAIAAIADDDGIDGISAIGGISCLLAPAILAGACGVGRTASGAVVCDTDSMADLARHTLADRVERLFCQAGARLASAAPATPSRQIPTQYANIAYAALLCGEQGSSTGHSVAARVIKFAGDVAKGIAGLTSADVVPLILAAVVACDTLYFAPATSASTSPAPATYAAQVAAFRAAFAGHQRGSVRGVPHGRALAARTAIAAAQKAWNDANPTAPGTSAPPSPARRSPARRAKELAPAGGARAPAKAANDGTRKRAITHPTSSSGDSAFSESEAEASTPHAGRAKQSSKQSGKRGSKQSDKPSDKAPARRKLTQELYEKLFAPLAADVAVDKRGKQRCRPFVNSGGLLGDAGCARARCEFSHEDAKTQ